MSALQEIEEKRSLLMGKQQQHGLNNRSTYKGYFIKDAALVFSWRNPNPSQLHGLRKLGSFKGDSRGRLDHRLLGNHTQCVVMQVKALEL